jgi:chemotaxis protein histidine kinase CheA
MTSLRDRVRPLPAGVLAAMQKDAKSAIEDLRATYLTVSREQIAHLQQLIGRAAPHDEAWQTEIYRVAHDLKGQGSTFNYDLVTRIAAGLCHLIKDGGTCEDAKFARRAIAHCQALQVVLDKDIRGLGGEHGAALLKILSIEE